MGVNLQGRGGCKRPVFMGVDSFGAESDLSTDRLSGMAKAISFMQIYIMVHISISCFS